MIVHYFNSWMHQLCPSIIKSYLQAFSADRFRFVLMERNDDDIVYRSIYEKLFNEYSFDNYRFCSSYKDLKLELINNQNFANLWHAGYYKWWRLTISLGCKNVSWVCWGGNASWNMPSIRKQQSFFKRYIGGLVDLYRIWDRRRVYNSFRSIIVLMEPDKQSICSDFHVDPSKIHYIPYISIDRSSYKELIDSLVENPPKNTKPKVLLGNNSCCIPYYMKSIDALKKFRGQIEVHCMLQYLVNKDEGYNNLVAKGHSLFGEDFYLDEEFMKEMKDYYHYLNKYDIYICLNPAQTGLGAIASCLLLGKPIILTGKNLQHVLNLGATVYGEDVLYSSALDSLLKKIPSETKLINRKIIESRDANSVEGWKQFFNDIEK